MAMCTQCGKSRGIHETVSGRLLCDACNKQMAQFAGAGSSMAGGNGVMESVTTGVAAGGFLSSMTGEIAAMRKRREKLDRTEGFWKRLWVRVVG